MKIHKEMSVSIEMMSSFVGTGSAQQVSTDYVRGAHVAHYRNYSWLHKLKQLIDLVSQRNYLFSYDGKWYGPLLNVEKAIAAYTRGSGFLEGTPTLPSRLNHQATFSDFWLRLVGIRDHRSVIVDDAWNRDHHESEVSLAKGEAALQRLVAWFLD